MTTIFINLLAFGLLLTSIFSITSKNPVISVIFLITTFVQAAGYLILIGINFIGISYIVIYVGAIAVLFLFVIMMINIKLTDILETGSNYTKNLPLAINIVTFFIFILFAILPFSFNNIKSPFFLNTNEFISIINKFTAGGALTPSGKGDFNYFVYPNSSDIFFTKFEQIEILGHNIYTFGAIFLIILSIILLLAMFATIIISKKNNNI